MSFGNYDEADASAEELALADGALTDWQAVQADYLPVMQESADRAKNADSRNDIALNGIAAGAGQTVDAQQKQANSALFQSGNAPSSGSFMMANTGAQRASAVSAGLTKGIVSNEANYLQGVGSVIQQGSGLLGTAKQGQIASAGIATGNSLLDQSAANAQSGLFGQVIGAGVGTYAAMGGFKPDTPGFTVEDAQLTTMQQSAMANQSADWMKPTTPAWQAPSGGF